jgi:hypothetical protein
VPHPPTTGPVRTTASPSSSSAVPSLPPLTTTSTTTFLSSVHVAAHLGNVWEGLLATAPRNRQLREAMQLAAQALEGLIVSELTLMFLANGGRRATPAAVAAAVRRAVDDYHLALGAGESHAQR